MKKIIFLLGAFLFLFCGCFRKTDENIVKDFKKKVMSTDNYYLSGELEIINNEDIYSYVVEVAYQKEDNFRVELQNKTNEHTQIILKNTEGVFVLTPSINKSFKFQSDWPYNSSQSYLLQTLITDMENENMKVEKTDDGIVITTPVNYSNNKNLVSEKIYIDKEANINKVEVLDGDGIVNIKMTFSDVDFSTKFDKDYFDLNSNMKARGTDKLDTTSKSIDDIVYPMFLPQNTYLASENKVSKTDGERVILTFSGEKPFTLVEETVDVKDKYDTVSMFGEPTMLMNTIGVVDDKVISWISDGVEYCLTSDSMNKEELLEVVASIAQVPIEK